MSSVGLKGRTGSNKAMKAVKMIRQHFTCKHTKGTQNTAQQRMLQGTVAIIESMSENIEIARNQASIIN